MKACVCIIIEIVGDKSAPVACREMYIVPTAELLAQQWSRHTWKIVADRPGASKRVTKGGAQSNRSRRHIVSGAETEGAVDRCLNASVMCFVKYNICGIRVCVCV